MSKRPRPKDEVRHRGRDETPRSHDRGPGRSSRGNPRREAPQGSPYTIQARSSGGGHHSEASESVSRSEPFMPSVSMASMSMLCSEFTPGVAPTTDTSMRDREHCGNCGEYREAPILPQWWKSEHFTDHPECLEAYQSGTCQLERTDAQIETENGADVAFRGPIKWVPPTNTKKPAQDCAPQTISTSAWSQGASQPSTQLRIVNPAYSNLQSNNPSIVYNQSAGYATPIGQTGNTGYAPSSYARQPAPHYSSNIGYIAPSYIIPPPVPSYPSNAASTSYTAPPERIPTGFSPPGQAPATGYPPPPAHYTSSNISYNTQQQTTHQPATNNPPQGEQYASATSGPQQGSSHRVSSHRHSSGHSHSHGHGHGNSGRAKYSKK
ncbi:hypothetical protein BHYA_0110g00130 [Botrytis hyacinthi]|uniref:Uncharacterized protein n=1 Tax=Botrytis hyacinthi TaxID=278943 RepID=A0A4Z1GL12_9HELO|nr:hypothetical protein BHYA_0110g00130 [Botrytis hyacinthi]